MLYEFSGSADFAVFGTVEVPDGVAARDYARTPAGKQAIFEAFREWWENTGIKLRDAQLFADGARVATEDEDEAYEIWPDWEEL